MKHRNLIMPFIFKRKKVKMMEIKIKYESSWRNSFLDGSNNEPLPKKGRNFIGSMTELKNEGNYISSEPTKDTIMGILNRLIGEQKKLYQVRKEASYYFREVESQIEFKDIPSCFNEEIVYLRNMKGNIDRNSFSGRILTDKPIFKAEYASLLWGVLYLSFENLLKFLDGQEVLIPAIEPDPISICERMEQKVKPIKIQEAQIPIFDKIEQKFLGNQYLEKGKAHISKLYCAALYIQLERLEKKYPEIVEIKTKNGNLSGFSKSGFTQKDFMNSCTTGSGKTVWGGPYMKTVMVKGEGMKNMLLKKAHGELKIFLHVEKEKAMEIKTRIENAGVSAFYLGKKGLAYVDNIKI